MHDYTGWSKSHATHIKIFIGGCSSLQFDWINRHTVSLWLYKSPRRSHHVVTSSRQTVSCLQTVAVQGCIFHKCSECSLSNTTWHLVFTSLSRMSLGIHFPILLYQTNRQYLVWWTVSGHCRNSIRGCISHEEKTEYMHRWTRWTFITPNMTNRTCVRNGLRDFLITLYLYRIRSTVGTTWNRQCTDPMKATEILPVRESEKFQNRWLNVRTNLLFGNVINSAHTPQSRISLNKHHIENFFKINVNEFLCPYRFYTEQCRRWNMKMGRQTDVTSQLCVHFMY
jgi:hypothetical protein